MLFKRDTATAREARLMQAAAPREAEPEVDLSAEPVEPPPPSREQLEIARLNDENATLRRDLAAMRQDWDSALQAAQAKARDAAAQAHMADDAARLRELREALQAAHRDFEDSLRNGLAADAQALAGAALSRLVKPSASEHAWLARAIERRIEELRSQVIVALHVPVGMDDALIANLASQLPLGAAIVADNNLRAGTARIALRLGRVEIDLARGLRDVLAMMAQGGDDA